MLFRKNGEYDIRIPKPELDHFIDAAFFGMLSILLSVEYSVLGIEWLYYLMYFAFVGLTAVKMFVCLRTQGKFILPWLAIWYIIFSIFVFASTFWSVSPVKTLGNTVRMLQIIVLLFCMAQNYSTPKGITKCFRFVSWAGMVCVFVILLRTPIEDWFVGKLGYAAVGQNTNNIAFILMVCAIISAFFAYYDRKKIYYLFATLQFFVLVLTGSRKSLIIICICLMMLVFLKDRSAKLLVRMLVAGVAICLVFYAIMNIPQLYNAIGRRFESMVQFAITDEGDGSIYFRSLFIKYARQFFLERPFFGSGFGSFALLFGDIWGRYSFSHNNYYELLVSFGLVGSAIYYSMYVYLLVRLIKKVVVYDSDSAKLAFTLFASIAASEFGMVLYYSVFGVLFIGLIFLYVTAHDIFLKESLQHGQVHSHHGVRKKKYTKNRRVI